jgi:two-component system CheB/CheR fusion protein
LRTGQQYQCEARFLCGDGGAYRWHLMRALPQLDPAGRVLGWYGTCTDIDDQKRAEQGLLDADRRKDEFLAMLAHELRNPLAPVRMAVEIMRRESVSEEVGRARDVIGRQVDHLVRLVDDLLDVSRITQGKIKLNKAMVDIERVIALAVETSRPLIESRRQMLSLEIRQKPLHVFGDAVRLAQIVSNLLNNAAKYTDEGGRIQLTVARSGSDLTITVKDNGIGLPKEMLGRIFELFVQVGGDQERAQGGLGIGLTLVNSLVQMHGGSVEARSPGLGLGSEFVVRLPVSILQERTPAAAAPTTEGPPTPSRRILIVDDNVDLTRTLARLLSNHCVRVAHDGISALETIPSFDPDVVVLDLGLPRMDGFQIARRIRQEPRNKPPILIAMSGYGQEEDRRRSKEAGFDHHLVKPISLADLESLLDGHASAVAERVPVTSRSV